MSCRCRRRRRWQTSISESFTFQPRSSANCCASADVCRSSGTVVSGRRAKDTWSAPTPDCGSKKLTTPFSSEQVHFSGVSTSNNSSHRSLLAAMDLALVIGFNASFVSGPELSITFLAVLFDLSFATSDSTWIIGFELDHFTLFPAIRIHPLARGRSEERRVGKECRYRVSWYAYE